MHQAESNFSRHWGDKHISSELQVSPLSHGKARIRAAIVLIASAINQHFYEEQPHLFRFTQVEL